MTGCDFDLAILIEEFVAESDECLDRAIDDVLCLEQGPDQEAIDSLFRTAHTLKGSAAILNFTALADFLHSFEDVCADIRSGKRTVERHTADNLLRCLDVIRAQLNSIRATHQEADDTALAAACLNALRQNECTPSPVSSLRQEALPDSVGQPVAWDSESLFSRIKTVKIGKTLIVENDFAARKPLFSFLSKFTTCHVAKDGSEAIQAVTESYMGENPEPFSLIIMDVIMPFIGGLQASRAIRALERAKGTPPEAMAKLFIATALDDPATRHAALHECEADAYITKPIDLSELAELIIRHFA
ncbi:Hpt domain-containing protein [Pseudodesulfovibrio sp.]|uniref:response regulator n=1 Tax=unclassified Pseudodesulfovibrio TaxID=2661612 RepID=UPI003AFF8A17